MLLVYCLSICMHTEARIGHSSRQAPAHKHGRNLLLTREEESGSEFMQPSQQTWGFFPPPSVLSSYVKLSAHYFVAKEWFEMEKQADNFTVKHMQSKQKLPGVIRGQAPPDLPWLHTGLAGRERSEAMRRCHYGIIHSPCRFPLVRSLTVTKTINYASLAT